jgi:GT2 family glycosyltransferase
MPRTVPKVTVVIPNWNGLCHLPECLASLAAQSFTDFDTLLVDNASTDEGVAWVRKQHPEVSVLELEDNGGFAKAVNTGIRASESQYVALLNNDTAVDRGWLEALVLALDQRLGYEYAASKIVMYSRPDHLNGAGDMWSRRGMTAVNRGYGQPASRYEEMERVFGACAGAALYRRTLFNEVGLFDEDFFLMHEDTDFNLRCLMAGKRCLYVPQALVRHKLGASISTRPALKMVRLLMRNETYAAFKNLPARMLWYRAFAWPYRLFRHTMAIRPPKWSRFPVVLLRLALPSLGAEIEGLRLGLAKRRDGWGRRTAGTREILGWLRRESGPV